jgi:Ca2+-binding RTX toxin-like protein
MVRLSDDEGAVLSLLEGWDGSSNPFGSGFLRLQQSGADTVLQWDRDGAAGGSAWDTLVLFENTTAGDFTEANFAPGYDPGGAVPTGETITGAADSDTLKGTIGNDTFDALGGDDTVMAGAGADIVRGGQGFDVLLGDADDDVVGGGDDDDFLYGGDGNDQLSGDAGNDVLNGEDGNDQLNGADGIDSLDGGAGGDALDGGDGDDFLAGGLGADVLVGGAGKDIFYFTSAGEGSDAIADFSRGSDTIYVSADGFGGGLVPEGSVSLVSGRDPVASATNGQFLFDTDDGRLLWDSDGTGNGSAVLVATLSNLAPLSASDFVVF